jgi:hypothetical protein
MNTHPRLARLATDELAREHREGPGPAPEQEAAAIAAIDQAIARAHAHRAGRRWLFGSVAAAAAAGAVIGIGTLRPRNRSVDPIAARSTVTAHARGLPVLVRDGREWQSSEDEEIRQDDRILAWRDEARLELSTGTRLEMEPGADVKVAEQTARQVYLLSAGTVRAYVAKLSPDQRFLVRTPDAEVEVRGTAFGVRWTDASSCISRTRVTVTEGIVVVRARGVEQRVSAGQDWPAGCAGTDAVQPKVAPSPVTEKTAPGIAAPIEPRFQGAGQPARTDTGKPPATSDLTAQNAMFAEIVAARKRGDLRGAIAACERLLSLHPSSTLAEDAFAQRMRSLTDLDDVRAREAAASYLTRYPNGFARDEARAILAKP